MALELKNKMKLDPGEVGAAAWLDRNQANIIASGVMKGDCSPLKIIAINKAGIEEECELPCSVLANIAPKSGPDIERISTGTRAN
ncbi:nucleoside diphosphate-linked moiety X motif 17 isoform X2 [Eurytemora carolleeae]|uniref:nucleoside diphosphate-linked moiety X motif 17 isoform X2 n=1 Tax=Eurytemora carolleeae TaxID=1294199 RepID=UPI000C78ABF3|nr:nucleoside diphosphate-linked moiety X motif 17 isoform X2 [Eurytemora carolleeae]|eukprot:XP_023330358.1 nucleoside diphosphate-linked moiety X motif 17-like isoform X2 [Eurytemora affinis]